MEHARNPVAHQVAVAVAVLSEVSEGATLSDVAALVVPRHWFAREPGWQFSLMLALEIVFLFVALPALSAGEASRNAVELVQIVLAATAIALVTRSPPLRVALAVSFGLTLLSRFLPGVMSQTITLSVIFAYNLLVTGAMARAVFGPGEVNHHRIAGAIFVYLNVALLFALAYSLLMLINPEAITGFPKGSPGRASEVIHLSFATLTSIGDGGVVPSSPFAHSLADLETIVGQLFPAVLLSRLVGLHLSRSL